MLYNFGLQANEFELTDIQNLRKEDGKSFYLYITFQSRTDLTISFVKCKDRDRHYSSLVKLCQPKRNCFLCF
jgi:hypothetical protein